MVCVLHCFTFVFLFSSLSPCFFFLLTCCPFWLFTHFLLFLASAWSPPPTLSLPCSVSVSVSPPSLQHSSNPAPNPPTYPSPHFTHLVSMPSPYFLKLFFFLNVTTADYLSCLLKFNPNSQTDTLLLCCEQGWYNDYYGSCISYGWVCMYIYFPRTFLSVEMMIRVQVHLLHQFSCLWK